MKYIEARIRRAGFWDGLLRYLVLRVGRRARWWWVGGKVQDFKRKMHSRGAGYWAANFLLLLALVVSLAGGYYTSPTLGGQISKTMVLRVAQRGDYELAESLLAQYQASSSKGQVLGVESTLEETVNPERKIEREIERIVKLVENYPTSRDLLLYASRLFGLLGNEEKASEYFEKARVLDPNGVI